MQVTLPGAAEKTKPAGQDILFSAPPEVGIGARCIEKHRDPLGCAFCKPSSSLPHFRNELFLQSFHTSPEWLNLKMQESRKRKSLPLPTKAAHTHWCMRTYILAQTAELTEFFVPSYQNGRTPICQQKLFYVSSDFTWPFWFWFWMFCFFCFCPIFFQLCR